VSLCRCPHRQFKVLLILAIRKKGRLLSFRMILIVDWGVRAALVGNHSIKVIGNSTPDALRSRSLSYNPSHNVIEIGDE
jgi:hypothetical protein